MRDFFAAPIFITLGTIVAWISVSLLQVQYVTFDNFELRIFVFETDLLFRKFFQAAGEGYYLLCQGVASLFMAIIILFVFCYYGQNATDKFAEVADAVNAVRWNEYPVDAQKYVVLALVRSQRPFTLTGFSLMDCCLRSFQTVSSNAEHRRDMRIIL